MKKITIILFALISSFSVFAQTVINDPNVEVRTLTGSFDEIKVSSGINLYLSQSTEEAVAVSSSKEKETQYIKTEIKGNTLHIYFDAPGGFQIRFGNNSMKAYVSFKTLEKLNASGACNVHVAGEMNVPSLAIDLSGASDFKGNVKAGSLSVELSGASDIKISGAVTNLTVKAGGASDFKGYDLAAEVCTAKATGASGIDITVNKELNAHATGASGIRYKGAGVIKDMQSSGASSINKRD